MIKEPLRSPNSTFIVRFWREWSAAAPRWRGHIVHVQSNAKATFMDIESMVEFVRRFGVMESRTYPGNATLNRRAGKGGNNEY